MSALGSDVQDAVTHWAEATPCIRRVWVFGSRARSHHRPGSLDIAVEAEPVADSEETLSVWIANAQRWQSQLEQRTRLPVDLEWFDQNGSTVKGAPEEAAVLVYERMDAPEA